MSSSLPARRGAEGESQAWPWQELGQQLTYLHAAFVSHEQVGHLQISAGEERVAVQPHGGESYECQIGRDLRDHLVQAFWQKRSLDKPSRILKVSSVGESTTGEIILVVDCSQQEKFSSCVQSESPQEQLVPTPPPLEKGSLHLPFKYWNMVLRSPPKPSQGQTNPILSAFPRVAAQSLDHLYDPSLSSLFSFLNSRGQN